MREKFNTMKKRLKNSKGFTLIELMATLVILALIIAIAVPAIGNITSKAKEQAADANIQLIENAAEIAFIDALELGADNSYTAEELVTGGYLKVEPEAIADKNFVATKVEGNNSGLFKVTSTPTPAE